MRCVVTGTPYTVFGHGGKQVRDNIHSADLVAGFLAYARDPKPAAVYNIGGGRFSNCSHIEAFTIAEEITGLEARTDYVDQARTGDHQWWISSTARFEQHYPDWKLTYDVPAILREMYEANQEVWKPTA